MTRALKTDLLDIVARLSARMFLGPELARSEEWLRISKEYSVDAHKAAHELTKMPSLLRPLLYWFSARCMSYASSQISCLPLALNAG